MNLKTAIKKAEEIAKNGTTEEKNAFVKWACEGIDYLKEQIACGCGEKEERKSLDAIKAQYKAYLRALTK